MLKKLKSPATTNRGRAPASLAACIRSVALGVLVTCGTALAQTSGAPSAGTEEKSKVIIYRGATVIDGSGTAPQSDMAVIVENDRIKAVVPDSEVGAQAEGAEVIDARGLYALPGLIDVHVHLATSPNRKLAEAIARRYLYSGITAVRDMAGDVRALADFARASRMGEIPAPDVYYSALMAGPAFFVDRRTVAAAQGATPGEVPWMQAITEDTNMPLAVAMARGTYASGIKIYANLPASLIGRITDEAHRQGIPVWAHASVFPAKPAEVIAAGVDVVSHVCLLPVQLDDRPPETYAERRIIDISREKGDHPEITALFREMRDRGTILDATLLIFAHAQKRAAEKAAQATNGKRPSGPLSGCSAEVAIKLTRQAYRENVQIAAGTDMLLPPQELYPALHMELEMLEDEAGMSALDVIKAATSTAARALGQHEQMGTIAAGKLANLVFVSKNPLEDVSNLRSVEFTVKRGVIYRRAEYVPISEDELPARMRGNPPSAPSQGTTK
ncbi:MAG TPA: amidohydrolase family protein [Steroidobacter sp.]